MFFSHSSVPVELIGIFFIARNAEKAGKNKQWELCVEEATRGLMTASHSTALRELRANCALAHGDLEQAAADLTYVITSPISINS
jgi:hypothetical protein